ncbi:MAG: acyl-CoA thioesterase [Rhodospirillales bacterium]|jgi:acyl-CoA thioester hydrolase
MTRTPPTATDEDWTRPEAYRHWLDERVRYSDLDPNDHANNGAIASYVEASRVAMFEHANPAIAAANGAFVIVRLVVDFKAELRYGQKIRIGGRFERFGNTSTLARTGLFRGDDCVAVAEAVLVLIDRTTRRPTPLSPDVRAALAVHA